MKNKNCEGCKSDRDMCDPKWINKNGRCPCTNCLVKVACSAFCVEAHEFVLSAIRKRAEV